MAPTVPDLNPCSPLLALFAAWRYRNATKRRRVSDPPPRCSGIAAYFLTQVLVLLSHFMLAFSQEALSFGVSAA